MNPDSLKVVLMSIGRGRMLSRAYLPPSYSWRLVIRHRHSGYRSDRHVVYMDYMAGECVKRGDINRAAEITDTIQQEADVSYRNATFKSLLYLYSRYNKPDDMLRIKQIMVDKGQLLDTSAYSSLVSGLAAVGQVDDAMQQLKEAQVQNVDLQARLFVPIIEKLVQLGQVEEGYKVWSEMVDKHSLWPSDVGLAGIIRALSDVNNEDWVHSICQELRDEYRELEPETHGAIAYWFESQRRDWTITNTSVNDKGCCCACGRKLESIDLTPERKAALLEKTSELLSGFENTEQLSDTERTRHDEVRDARRLAITQQIRKLEAQVTQLETNGANNMSRKIHKELLEERRLKLKLLQKNMPLTLNSLYERLGLQPPLLKEVKHFKQWIARTGPYDVVVDVLNVAGFNSKRKFDLLKVETVVRHFLEKEKRVLLISRKHLYDNNRYRPILKRLTDETDKCHAYYTSNRRVDDWFFLYAAVCGGMEIELVTNDLMRDHRQLFHGRLFQDFLKWQQGHQIKLLRWNKDKYPVFQRPHVHNSVVQWTDDSWHFPLAKSSRWLCVCH